jgi:hypothetical protein
VCSWVQRREFCGVTSMCECANSNEHTRARMYVCAREATERRVGNASAVGGRGGQLNFVHVAFPLGCRSGVSLHEHTNAWNALVYGEKHWVLLPPYSQFGPVSLELSEWVRNWRSVICASRHMCMLFPCSQTPNSLLFNSMFKLILACRLGRCSRANVVVFEPASAL